MKAFLKHTFIVIGLLVCFSVSSGSAHAQNTFSVPVKSNWGGGTFGVTGEPGKWKYRYFIVERNGVVFVCGAGHATGRMQEFAWQMQQRAEVKLNGKTYLRNIQFFKRVRRPNSESLVGEEAKCKSTRKKMPPGRVNIEVDLSPGFVR
ncbi:MAG: hypothetical protein AAFQ66_20710 [Pseudomonadota bacterium]